jgi:hypothetical protein
LESESTSLTKYNGRCTFWDLPGSSRSTTNAALTTWVVAEIYRSIGPSVVGAASIEGLLSIFLRDSSASCDSGVHMKWSDFFISLYSGSLHSLSCAMERLRATRQPVTRCTPFRFLIGPMSMMAEILSGLASTPRFDTTKPRSMPLGTSKTHFLKFSFTLCCRSFSKTLVRSVSVF